MPAKGRCASYLNVRGAALFRISYIVFACALLLGQPSFAAESCDRHCLDKLLAKIVTLQQQIERVEEKTKQTDKKLKNSTNKVIATIPPLGTILTYAGSQALPAGYMLCDGATLDKVKYAALFHVIGLTYTPAEEYGSGSFRLPDLRGRTLVAAGLGNGLTERSVGDVFGEEIHQLTVRELPVHTHTDAGHGHGINDPGHSHLFNDGGNHGLARGNNLGDRWEHFDARLRVRTGITVYNGNANIQSTGGDQPHNNVQPSLVVNYIIKVQ